MQSSAPSDDDSDIKKIKKVCPGWGTRGDRLRAGSAILALLEQAVGELLEQISCIIAAHRGCEEVNVPCKSGRPSAGSLLRQVLSALPW